MWHCKIFNAKKFRKRLSVLKSRFINYNFIIVINTQAKIILTNVFNVFNLLLTFLSSYCRKYFFENATIYNSRNKGITVMIYGSKSGKYSVINLLRLFLSVKCQKIKTYCFFCKENVEFYTILIQKLAIFLTHSHLFL